MKTFNILIIDDASMIRDLIKKFVRDYFPNAKIFDANNGQTGRSVLIHQDIDLILCDWEMPEMNGLELLDWIRNEPNYQNKPFIMVTSRGDKEYVMEAIQKGVSDYLVKPFNRPQFAEKVGKALKRHGIKGKMVEPASIASSSLDVLTGGSAKITTNKPAAPKKKKPLPKGAAIVRTPEGEVKCAIKRLDKDHCLGIFKIAGYVPSLQDQVSVDIEFKADGIDKAMRINGFIKSLSLNENKPDCPLIELNVSFMDEDPQKHQMIQEFVAQFS